MSEKKPLADLQCVFDGQAFVPSTPFQLALVRDRYGEGEILAVSVQNERNMAAHRAQFAIIRTAWLNLPEECRHMDYAASADTLRKYALIRTGYHELITAVAYSKAAAVSLAAALGSMGREAHGYAIVEAEKRVVRCWTPESQAVRSMGSERFLDSMKAIIDFAASLVGVSVDELEDMGKRAIDVREFRAAS